MDNTLIYCKYRFESAQEFEQVVGTFIQGFEMPLLNVFTLNGYNFYLIPMYDKLDEQGNVIEIALTGFHVDIVFDRVVIPEILNQYEVFPEPIGIHGVMGIGHLYEQRYNQMTQPPEAE